MTSSTCGDWATIADLSYQGIRPPFTKESAPYWAGLGEHRVLVERCVECSLHSFPPRGLCRRCGARTMEWVDAEGPGVIYSYTVNHHPWTPGPSHYVVVLVELPKCSGVRLMGFLDSQGPPEIGGLVDFGFASAFGDLTRLHFVPRGES